MGAREWFRALQVPVLPVSVGPAVVGSLLGGLRGGRIDGVVFALVVASLACVQLGANLQKGLVESADLGRAPVRPRYATTFDAGAVLRAGPPRETMRRVALGLFGAGACLGLAVVLLRRDPWLLAFGAAGAFLAFEYSGPPLKLSYRGVGEAATFLAFGPIMLLGSSYAQNPAFAPPDLWLGVAFGFLAAAISFARYFPAIEEDRLKSKRTPVVRLGRRLASAILACLYIGGGVTLGLGDLELARSFAVPAVPMAASLVASGVLANRSLAFIQSGQPATCELGVACAVGVHYVVSAATGALLLAALARVF